MDKSNKYGENFELNNHELEDIEIVKLEHSNTVVRLYQEIAWLRKELANTKQKLKASEELIAQLEKKNEHLKLIANGDNPDQKGKKDQSSISKTNYNLMPQVKYPDSITLCKIAVEELKKTVGHDHPDVATLLHILAHIYRDQEKDTEVENLLKEVLSIRDKTLDKNHPAIFETLRDLVPYYVFRDKYQDAEPLCKRALEICEKLLGRDHPDVADLLTYLGKLCQCQGKNNEAEKYCQRALGIPNVIDVTLTQVILSDCYIGQKRYEEAENLCKKLLTRAHECEFGSISSHNQPIWQMAEEIERQEPGTPSLDDWIRVPKKNNTLTCCTLISLSDLYERRKMFKAAKTLKDCAKRLDSDSAHFTKAGEVKVLYNGINYDKCLLLKFN